MTDVTSTTQSPGERGSGRVADARAELLRAAYQTGRTRLARPRHACEIQAFKAREAASSTRQEPRPPEEHLGNTILETDVTHSFSWNWR